MRSTYSLPLALITLAALSGCGMFSTADKNVPLIPAPRSPIADIPIPAGFEVMKQSSSKEVPGSNLRFVDYHFKGPDDLLPVVKFYRDEMPKFKWERKDQTSPHGEEFSLNFTKANETCAITITQHTFSTEIHVRIDPVGRNAEK